MFWFTFLGNLELRCKLKNWAFWWLRLILSDVRRFAWLGISLGAYRLTRASSFLSLGLLLLLYLPILRQISNPGCFRSCRCPSICLSTQIAGFLSSFWLVLRRLTSGIAFRVFNWVLLCNHRQFIIAIFVVTLIFIIHIFALVFT